MTPDEFDTSTGAHADPPELYERRLDEVREQMRRVWKTNEVLDDVREERRRQFAKWGPQHHPDGTSDDSRSKAKREMARDMCDSKSKRGAETWLDILTEETLEAYAEVDLAALEKELIQTAAVAVAWIEDIRSRRG